MTVPLLLLFASLAALLFMFAVALKRKTDVVQSKDAALPRLYELVARYRFFQGKNLETFSRLLSANNLTGIEQLIREKFEAQKKPNASKLAQQIIQKLGS